MVDRPRPSPVASRMQSRARRQPPPQQSVRPEDFDAFRESDRPTEPATAGVNVGPGMGGPVPYDSDDADEVLAALLAHLPQHRGILEQLREPPA